YVAFTYIFDDGEWIKRAYFQADPTRQTRSVSYQLTLPAGVHSVVVQSHIRSYNGSQSGIDKIYVTESWDSALVMSLWDMGPTQGPGPRTSSRRRAGSWGPSCRSASPAAGARAWATWRNGRSPSAAAGCARWSRRGGPRGGRASSCPGATARASCGRGCW